MDGWVQIGCFEESSAGTLSFFFDDSPTMTVQQCVDICDSADFILAGLEGGTQCHCGNIIKNGGTPAMLTSCNVPCGGDVNSFCGGVSGQRILLYELTPFVIPTVVPKVKRWSSIGCWSDDPQTRALHDDGGGSDGQTVEDCIATCEDGGFALAGVEFGLQCFCGNAVLYNHLQIADSDCTLGCAGDPHELCGDLGAMNLYQFANTPFTFGQAVIPQTYLDWTYLACTQEDPTGRALPTSIDFASLEDVTVEKCLDACSAQNFLVAGLQFGEECRCGNVTLPPGMVVDDSQCNLPCNDNANEFCGGAGTNQVYYLPGATFATD
jgi:hypothetical protein